MEQKSKHRGRPEGSAYKHPPKGKLTKRDAQSAAYPHTQKVILDTCRYIREGKSRATIIQTLIDTEGYAEVTATEYYQRSMRLMIPKDVDEYHRQIIAANLSRLETLIERTMDEKSTDKDYRLAKDLIAEVNKICGIGNSNKVEIAKNKDGEEAIRITFDQG